MEHAADAIENIRRERSQQDRRDQPGALVEQLGGQEIKKYYADRGDERRQVRYDRDAGDLSECAVEDDHAEEAHRLQHAVIRADTARMHDVRRYKVVPLIDLEPASLRVELRELVVRAFVRRHELDKLDTPARLPLNVKDAGGTGCRDCPQVEIRDPRMMQFVYE